MMNKIFIILVSIVFSGFANASGNENDKPRQGIYVGAGYGLSSEVGFLGFERDITPSLNFYIGSATQVVDNIYLGLDVSYHYLGQSDYSINNIFDITAYGVSVNAKPRYYFEDSGFYVSGIFGLGNYYIELEAPGGMASDREFGFTYGIEGGYEFSSGIGLALGHTRTSADMLGITMNFLSTYLDASYKF